MVADRGLGHVAARREVTGADLALRGELAKDREAGGVRGGLEKPDVGIGRTLHCLGTISALLDIDNDQY